MHIQPNSLLSDDSEEIRLLITSSDRSGLMTDEKLFCLLVLSVIAKENPTNFVELCQPGLEKQKGALSDLLKKSSFLKQNFVLDDILLKFKYLFPETLTKFVSYISKVNNFKIFSEQLMLALQKNSHRSQGTFTDQVIVQIIKGLIGDASQLTIYDGASGWCSLVSQMNSKKLFLQDINAWAAGVGKSILFLKDIDFEYHILDSLSIDKKSYKVDLVITEPPWGVRFNPQTLDKIKESKYLQVKNNIRIPTSANDSLWIQHSLYHLNNNGRSIMLLPQGWLFRGGYDAELRNFLIESDLIDTVIGLPAGLLTTSGIPTVLLIFNKNKMYKNIINFIDASKLGHRVKRQLEFSDDEIKLIVDAGLCRLPESEYYRAVPKSEINKNNNNLSINHYFISETKWETLDLDSEKKLLEQAQEKFSVANKKLMELLID